MLCYTFAGERKVSAEGQADAGLAHSVGSALGAYFTAMPKCEGEGQAGISSGFSPGATEPA